MWGLCDLCRLRLSLCSLKKLQASVCRLHFSNVMLLRCLLFFLKALETQLWTSAASWRRSTSAACKYNGHKAKTLSVLWLSHRRSPEHTLCLSPLSGSGCPPGTGWTSWGAELWARPCARLWPLTPSSRCWPRLTWRHSTDVCLES